MVTDGVRRVAMSRDTLSAATTLCAEERGQEVGDVVGISMLKLLPDLTLGSCSDSQSPLGNTNVPKQGEGSQSTAWGKIAK